jgi:hypothetical protein
MHTERTAPLHVVILGTDAVLAAHPAEPIQLARACLRAGFDFVAPVSWGEELLASRVADVVEARQPAAAVIANCPFVAESMRAATARTRCIASVSPPIATARYVRAAFPGRPVHVTYVGACPGATGPDVDDRLAPEVFLAGLVDLGIDLQLQPCHLDGQLPADRSRHASIPGGMPETRWLEARVGARTVEATPATVDAVATMHSRTNVVLDLAAACGCACAEARAAAARLDPPRSRTPVVLPFPVQLADHRLLQAHRLVDLTGAIDAERARVRLADRLREQRATFVARGLSDVGLRPAPLLTGPFAAAPSRKPASDPLPGTGNQAPRDGAASAPQPSGEVASPGFRSPLAVEPRPPTR